MTSADIPTPPLTLDELATRLDEPATAAPSDEAVAAASAESVTIAATELDLTTLVEPVDGGLRLRLPPGIHTGLPGRTAYQVTDADDVGTAGGPRSTDGYRPATSALVYQPKTTMEFAPRQRIRRVDGSEVQPFYGVFPPEDRQTYYPSTYPWGCVGKIFTKTDFASPSWSWRGSGVLVGPRHVLTAGHVCPWDTATQWGMLFVPSYWDGAPLAGAAMTSWVSDFRGWNPGVAARDMCVLRLYEPLGNTLGWMGSKVYSPAWQGGAYWTLTGYPGAIASGERPAYQNSIAVIDDDPDGDAAEVEHLGDASPGESGGPLFGWWDNIPYTIGTLSGGNIITAPNGTVLEDNNINAGGAAMVNLIDWARTNWP
ncbi:trypsin-like serine peptidase [Nocardia sp. FBN12]|uniref:trypsin-like serine peptidase n=1 Tax=Nocardia sp. FBN12 TaxID=3419766 RepID=UPI003D083310